MSATRRAKILTILLTAITASEAVARTASPFCDFTVFLNDALDAGSKSAWSITRKSPRAGEMDVILQNSVTGETRRLTIPWNAMLEKQDRAFSNVILSRIKSLTSKRHPQIELFPNAPNSRLALELNAQISSQLERFADNVDDIAKLDPHLPQQMLLELEKSVAVQKTLQQAGGPPVMLITQKGTENFGWMKRFSNLLPNGQGISWRSAKGVETLTVNLQKTGATMTAEEAIELFYSKLYFDLRSQSNSIAQSLPPYGYRLEIKGLEKPFTLNYVDGERLRRWGSAAAGSELANAPAKTRNYVINAFRDFGTNLNYGENQLRELRRISIRMQDRTKFIFITDEAGAVKGAMNIVESKGVQEKLPLEEFTGLTLQRKPGKKIAELGRFAVSPDWQKFTSRFYWQTSALVASTQRVERVLAETFERYANELISKRGYRTISDPGYAKAKAAIEAMGKPAFVIEASPDQIMRNSLPDGN